MNNLKTKSSQWEQIYKGEGKDYKYYDILETPHPDLGKVVKIFKELGVKKVLDLGCGAGRNILPLANNFSVYGLDSAPSGLKILRKTLKERRLQADLKLENAFAPLPYRDNYFDALISVQVLQHAKETAILKTIKEITRIVKPGGLIFITLCGRISKGKIRLFLVKLPKKLRQTLICRPKEMKQV